MPEADPAAVSAVHWAQIGDWMHWFWAYFFTIVTLALTFLAAHAIVPSLVASGHLSDKFLKLRQPLYVGVIALIGLAMLFLTWTVNNAHLLETLYNRFWI